METGRAGVARLRGGGGGVAPGRNDGTAANGGGGVTAGGGGAVDGVGGCTRGMPRTVFVALAGDATGAATGNGFDPSWARDGLVPDGDRCGATAGGGGGGAAGAIPIIVRLALAVGDVPDDGELPGAVGGGAFDGAGTSSSSSSNSSTGGGPGGTPGEVPLGGVRRSSSSSASSTASISTVGSSAPSPAMGSAGSAAGGWGGIAGSGVAPASTCGGGRSLRVGGGASSSSRCAFCFAASDGGGGGGAPLTLPGLCLSSGSTRARGSVEILASSKRARGGAPTRGANHSQTRCHVQRHIGRRGTRSAVACARARHAAPGRLHGERGWRSRLVSSLARRLIPAPGVLPPRHAT